jgi:mRNA interferase MazF
LNCYCDNVKDFDNWNVVKKYIDMYQRSNVITGSIWICNFGLNIGYEIDGKREDYIRPALVVFGLGRGGGIVIPITTVNKNNKFLVPVTDNTWANITQIRYLDSRRFKRKVSVVDDEVLGNVQDAVCQLFKRKTPRHNDQGDFSDVS